MPTIKEQIYMRERLWLAPEACLSENTLGRDMPATPDDARTEFQRDRDRITHCRAFRRLMHKTQVFLSPEDDHYRTRLTHTLEVTQIGRSIARAMRLNEDLTEAVCLGHDLGHTPFGHAGERELGRHFKGFRHNEQSLRVVEVLENLNLTKEVRDGILHHSFGGASTLEGQIALFADKIAYLNHDYDDAVMAGIILPDDPVYDLPLPLKNKLGYTRGERIDTMVKSILRHGFTDGAIDFEPEIAEAKKEFSDFMFYQVYTNPKAKSEEKTAEKMLGMLFEYFCEHPDEMPESYSARIETDGVERCVVDYCSGMTDRYAIATFKNLFIPKVWQI